MSTVYFGKCLPTYSQLLPVHPSAHVQVYVDPVVEHWPPFIQYPEYVQSEISDSYVRDPCIMLPTSIFC